MTMEYRHAFDSLKERAALEKEYRDAVVAERDADHAPDNTLFLDSPGCALRYDRRKEIERKSWKMGNLLRPSLTAYACTWPLGH